LLICVAWKVEGKSMNDVTEMTAELAAMCASEVTALENPVGAFPAPRPPLARLLIAASTSAMPGKVKHCYVNDKRW
jgi:hypothetical protein